MLLLTELQMYRKFMILRQFKTGKLKYAHCSLTLHFVVKDHTTIDQLGINFYFMKKHLLFSSKTLKSIRIIKTLTA